MESKTAVLTVPKDLGLSNNSQESKEGYEIQLHEDWESGIGGGLWTTGLALAKYFCTSHFLQEFQKRKENHRPLTVLELGSGNGFLGVCLVVAVGLASANQEDWTNWPGVEVCVTDTAEHMGLMKTTIRSNLERILPQILKDRTESVTYSVDKIASVKEYLWGESYDFGDTTTFDLIVGSDVAYRDHLHDPLIAALEEFSKPAPHPPTMALIGVTMSDTKPIFFEKLTQKGFRYEKLADHLFDTEFATCSRQFGIFAITRIRENSR